MPRPTAAQRRRLPASAFAYPSKRKYLINTRAEARMALVHAASKRTYGSYAHVARAVNRRYPGLAKHRRKPVARSRTARRRTGRRSSNRRR